MFFVCCVRRDGTVHSIGRYISLSEHASAQGGASARRDWSCSSLIPPSSRDFLRAYTKNDYFSSPIPRPCHVHLIIVCHNGLLEGELFLPLFLWHDSDIDGDGLRLRRLRVAQARRNILGKNSL